MLPKPKTPFMQRILRTVTLADTDQAIPKRMIVRTENLGSYCVKSYGGYPTEDYLQTMNGRARADIFDKMRRSDPQIMMCLGAVKNPIKSASWEIEPGD